jgi:hypothetical protein
MPIKRTRLVGIFRFSFFTKKGTPQYKRRFWLEMSQKRRLY